MNLEHMYITMLFWKFEYVIYTAEVTDRIMYSMCRHCTALVFMNYLFELELILFSEPAPTPSHDCYYTYSDERGVFYSPGFPDYYGVNEECAYIITTSKQDNTITVTILPLPQSVVYGRGGGGLLCPRTRPPPPMQKTYQLLCYRVTEYTVGRIHWWAPLIGFLDTPLSQSQPHYSVAWPTRGGGQLSLKYWLTYIANKFPSKVLVVLRQGRSNTGELGEGARPLHRFPIPPGTPTKKKSCLMWTKWTKENLCPHEKARPPVTSMHPTGKIQAIAPLGSRSAPHNSYTGWPRINGTVDTVDFQDFALINN